MKVAPPKPPRLVLDITRLSPDARRRKREFDRELRSVPRPVPWDWAAPRLMPLLAGPRLDPPGETLVRVTTQLGPAVEFGFAIGSQFARVDTVVAERWECTDSQLLDRAMDNLRTEAGMLNSGSIRTGVMSGRQVRLLDGDPPWASSLVLDGAGLKRVFGSHDQLLAACRTDCLLSMTVDTPTAAFAAIAVDFEREAESLWLDPFLLTSGDLSWAEAGGDTLDDWDDRPED